MMKVNEPMALMGLAVGGVLLVIALVSTLSKVTLVLFNPWLLREVTHRDEPKKFLAIVSLYWILGLVGVMTSLAILSGLFG